MRSMYVPRPAVSQKAWMVLLQLVEHLPVALARIAESYMTRIEGLSTGRLSVTLTGTALSLNALDGNVVVVVSDDDSFDYQIQVYALDGQCKGQMVRSIRLVTDLIPMRVQVDNTTRQVDGHHLILSLADCHAIRQVLIFRFKDLVQ